MVHPPPAAPRIVPCRMHGNDDGVLPQKIAVDHPHAIAPPRKRRRESAEVPRKRRREERRGLCQLNLDELYIIFAYIYPMDLLNLARTSKSLRGLLMHRSSSFLWRNALRQIEGLPECPADLDEPEYANLVFYSRCHNCDKLAKTILWNMRRRYCPTCRAERLCDLRFCNEIVRENEVLPDDWLIIGENSGQWVDRVQVDIFMHEYQRSFNKTRFLEEKRKERQMIYLHARKCEAWQQQKGRIHRFDLEVLRKERETSIFERLRQRGYGPEIAHFGGDSIKKSYKSIFKKYKPLLDSEWNRAWPQWDKIMNDFRSTRIETTLCLPRRRSLISEYRKYVMEPSPDVQTFGFLPNLVDLTAFPPFRDIIRAPEEVQLDDEPFASAFAQLPELVDEWMNKLNSEVAGLVEIPSGLRSDSFSGDPERALGSTRRAETSEAESDKLSLACAVFHVDGAGVFAYPEVLSVSMHTDLTLPFHDINFDTIVVILRWFLTQNDLERTGSIRDRFGLQFLEEAPYIIHACGLDPNAATADDMDYRNARLKCVTCAGPTLVMNWRHAIWHARFYHCISIGLLPLSESPRWQRLGDEHIDAIQAIERTVSKTFSPDWTQCLLCRAYVGDALMYPQITDHVFRRHNVEKSDIKEGVHYKLMGIRDACGVEMVGWGDQVTFRVLQE